jgi:hypothetical protein
MHTCIAYCVRHSTNSSRLDCASSILNCVVHANSNRKYVSTVETALRTLHSHTDYWSSNSMPHDFDCFCDSDNTCSLGESSHTFLLHFPTVCGRIADYWTYLTICQRSVEWMFLSVELWSPVELHSFGLFFRFNNYSDRLGLRVNMSIIVLRLLVIGSSTIQRYGF